MLQDHLALPRLHQLFLQHLEFLDPILIVLIVTEEEGPLLTVLPQPILRVVILLLEVRNPIAEDLVLAH